MPKAKKADPSLYVWNEEDMKKALKAHLYGMPLRAAAEVYNVKRSTLSRYATAFRDRTDEEKEEFSYTPAYDNRRVFTIEQELQLEEYILQAARMHYGLSKKRAREPVWLMAKRNGLAYPSSWDTEKSAGKDGLYGFLRKQPSISLRRPEPTSIQRNLGFNRVAVDTFYRNLGELYSKYKFPASRIFNLDETGLTNVQTKCQRVLSPKGVKQLGATTSQKRGKLVTMVGTINAMGGFIPAFLIFPRARFVERSPPHRLLE